MRQLEPLLRTYQVGRRAEPAAIIDISAGLPADSEPQSGTYRASRDQALQNALRHAAAGTRTALHPVPARSTEPAFFGEKRDLATQCDMAETAGMGDTGLEPVTSRV